MKLLFSTLLFSLSAASEIAGRGLTGPSATALSERWDMDKPDIDYVPDEDKFTFTFLTASEDNYNEGLAESFWNPDCMPAMQADGNGHPLPKSLIYEANSNKGAFPMLLMTDVSGVLKPQMQFQIDPAAFAAESSNIPDIYSGATPSCDTTDVPYSLLLNNMVCPSSLFTEQSVLSLQECYSLCVSNADCTQFSVSAGICTGCEGTAASLMVGVGAETYEICPEAQATTRNIVNAACVDPLDIKENPTSYATCAQPKTRDEVMDTMCTDTSTAVKMMENTESICDENSALFNMHNVGSMISCHDLCYEDLNCQHFSYTSHRFNGRCLGCATWPSSVPALPSLGTINDIKQDDNSNLGLCEGDCDNDSECASGFYCHVRINSSSPNIPGCDENPLGANDYCLPGSDFFSMCPRPARKENVSRIDFCIRSSLGYTISSGNANLAENRVTGLQTASNYQEVNFIETLVRIEYDMSSGFTVNSVSVAPKNRELTTISESYEDALIAYLCDTSAGNVGAGGTYTVDSNESYPRDSSTADPFNQGALITVCVRVKDEFASQNIVLKELTDFSWSRSGGTTFNRAIGGGDDATTITQVAITGSEAAGNYLTSYDKTDCVNKYWCQFASVLFAQFYNTPGSVTGTGDAILQFKTTRNRRLGEGVDERSLQDDPGSAGMDISIDVNGVAEGPGDIKTASGPSCGVTTISVSVITALIGAVLLA